MLYLKSDLKFSMYEHRSPRLKARQASVAKETCGSELNRVIYCYPKQVVIYWPFYRWFTVTYLPYSMPTQDVSGHWGKRKIEHKYFHSFLTHSACELGPQDVCYVMPESTPRIGDCGLRIAARPLYTGLFEIITSASPASDERMWKLCNCKYDFNEPGWCALV